mmetsp:Transcript_141075/g.450524  ORF Transcript_141075/g.450524 Transcript_141075/m.450524 type:complete len:308 (-) Transcript_141075:410-1333(-)
MRPGSRSRCGLPAVSMHRRVQVAGAIPRCKTVVQQFLGSWVRWALHLCLPDPQSWPFRFRPSQPMRHLSRLLPSQINHRGRRLLCRSTSWMLTLASSMCSRRGSATTASGRRGAASARRSKSTSRPCAPPTACCRSRGPPTASSCSSLRPFGAFGVRRRLNAWWSCSRRRREAAAASASTPLATASARVSFLRRTARCRRRRSCCPMTAADPSRQAAPGWRLPCRASSQGPSTRSPSAPASTPPRSASRCSAQPSWRCCARGPSAGPRAWTTSGRRPWTGRCRCRRRCRCPRTSRTTARAGSAAPFY